MRELETSLGSGAIVRSLNRAELEVDRSNEPIVSTPPCCHFPMLIVRTHILTPLLSSIIMSNQRNCGRAGHGRPILECYDDDMNVVPCPNTREHRLPNGTEHPTLKPHNLCVWDGRMGIQPTSIIKNGHHCWQVNICQGSEVQTYGLNSPNHVSPFSNEAYAAHLAQGERENQLCGLVDRRQRLQDGVVTPENTAEVEGITQQMKALRPFVRSVLWNEVVSDE